MGAAKPETYSTPLLWSKIRLIEKSLVIAKILEEQDLRLFDRNCAITARACCDSTAAEHFHWWQDLGVIEPSTKASYPSETHLTGHKVFRFKVSVNDLKLRIVAMTRELRLERQLPRGLKKELVISKTAASYGFHNAFHFSDLPSLLQAA
jgi:hypothetical protein